MRTKLLLATTALIAASAVFACSSDDASVPPDTSGAGAGTTTAPPDTADAVDILRDERGLPHIWGGSQASAFYGLGYVTAEDRLFQMEMTRRYMRGQLSEVFAGNGDSQVDAKLLAHDVRMRTLGFARHAETVIANPDFPAEIRELLAAYTAGINAYLSSDEFTLPAMFANVGIDAFAPWTEADAMLAWERIRERFNADGSDGEIDQLIDCESPNGCDALPCTPPIDEAAAVVPETTPWPPSSASACYEPKPRVGKPIEFKASHGWVVHGSRTTTGKPVLAMDPKLKLTAPAYWYAYHIAWPGTSAAGAGVAGAPGYLIFWNENVAQTLTAGGGDVSDLFELTLSSDGTGYVVDGQTKAFDAHDEVIAVKGSSDVTITVRDSSFGPVVDDVVSNVPQGRSFAMRHIDLMYQDTHSLVGIIELMSATDLDSYMSAFDKWLSPGANAIFATNEGSNGHIGYVLAGAVGKRAPNIIDGKDFGGEYPYDGSSSSNDWQGYLSVHERPHVIDPPEGYLFTANHRPVGSWYDDYAYTGIKSVGDTLRSLRLRYMFSEALPTADTKLSPDQVHAMHFDAEQDAVRLFGDMLSQLASTGAIPSSAPAVPTSVQEKAAKTLGALALFAQNGGELRFSNPQYPLANKILGETPFEMRVNKNPEIFCKFNSSEGGYSMLVKAFDADPVGTMNDQVVASFVVNEAARLWDELTSSGLDQDPSLWRAPDETPPFTVDAHTNQYCPISMADDCSLDPSQSFDIPLDAANGATILSSLGSSGTATIDFSNIEQSVQLVPMGSSADPTSPFFQSGISELLAADAAELSSTPAAPLARELVEPNAVSTMTLKYTPEL